MHAFKLRSARAQRGSVLLLAIVMVVVLGLLASAAISFSNSELASARTMRLGDETLACADAGRQYLLSKFKLFAVNPTSMTLLMASDASTVPATVKGVSAACTPGNGVRCISSGHIGSPAPTSSNLNVDLVTAVHIVPNGGDHTSKNAVDLTNRAARTSSLGGSDYQVVVHCTDTSPDATGTKQQGHDTEVEFVVRFGL